MPPPPHHIERLLLDVDLPDLGSALHLRGRAEDLSRTRFPALLERVLDRLVPDDLLIRLDRLDLDLGAVTAEGLEEEATAALERALTDAITDAIAAARHGASTGTSLEAAELEDFDTYLLHGAVRFHDAADPFDPGVTLRRLIAGQPQALVAVLRRLARYRHALERLVLQATPDDLRALLTILTPADAAVILTYHADLRRLYLQTPGTLAEPVLRRALWVLTLEFLLRDAGTQSNRRAFVGHLIEGIAVAEGIAYPLLLDLLRAALHETRRQRPITGSLPGVIEELFARRAANTGRPEVNAKAGAVGPEQTVDLETLLDQLRAAAGNPAALEALVWRLSAPVFDQLIERLEPAHAAPILAYVHGLTSLHHQAALLALSEAGFEHQVQLLVLRYLLRDAGSQFNRRSWLRRLLRGLAAAGGVSYDFLLESLARALALLRRPAGSLPRAVSDLAADMPRSPATDPAMADADKVATLLSRLRLHKDDHTASATLVQGIAADDFRQSIEHLRPGHAAAILGDVEALAELQRRRSLFGLSSAAFERHLRGLALRSLLAEPPPPFHRLSWLKQLLQHLAPAIGTDHGRMLAALAQEGSDLPPGSALARVLASGNPDTVPAEDATALARRFSQADGPGKASLIRWLAGDMGLLRRVVAILDDAVLTAALGALGRARPASVEADLALLRRRHAASPLATLDADGFRALVWALALATLAQGEGRIEGDGMRRALLAGLARHEGVSAREFGDWRSLANVAAPSPIATSGPAELLRFAEHFLRTGQPPALGPRLSDAARSDPAGFAELLRRLTAAASGESRILIDRLLTWMLPEEILVALQPDLADRATMLAAHLADLPGGTMAAAWTRILDATLSGKDPDLAHVPVTSGEREDRLALLGHWLDHGKLPWWAPPATRIDALLADLPRESAATLRRLLDDADPERAAARLRRAVARMKPDAGAGLIERLAPWAFAASGPLAPMSAGLTGRALEDLRIRAAVAAMAGAPLDLTQLARPVPTPPEREEPAPPPGQQEQAMLFAWLSGTGPDNPPALAGLLRLLADLADRGDRALDKVLREGLTRPGARTRWAQAMPEEIFARVMHRIAPARARFALDLMATLRAAKRQAAPSSAVDAGRELRSLVLAMLAEQEAPAPRTLVSHLIAAIEKETPDAAQRLRNQAASIARQSGHANIVAALQPERSAEPARPGARADQQVDWRADAPPPPPTEIGTVMYVRNAGLVLFNPFLPRFFEQIGVTTTGSDGVARITGVEAASRAVHLLQYLVDGQCDRPEPDLLLNKLLCGIDASAPVARSIIPDEKDRAICDQMMRAMIGNWTIIKNTSPAGLRETFLQRDGRLRREDGRWTLDVERRTVDVLTDQIPWSFAVVYHRWMPQPLHVNW